MQLKGIICPGLNFERDSHWLNNRSFWFFKYHMANLLMHKNTNTQINWLSKTEDKVCRVLPRVWWGTIKNSTNAIKSSKSRFRNTVTVSKLSTRPTVANLSYGADLKWKLFLTHNVIERIPTQNCKITPAYSCLSNFKDLNLTYQVPFPIGDITTNVSSILFVKNKFQLKWNSSHLSQSLRKFEVDFINILEKRQ